jgi:hypothetical protein
VSLEIVEVSKKIATFFTGDHLEKLYILNKHFILYIISTIFPVIPVKKLRRGGAQREKFFFIKVSIGKNSIVFSMGAVRTG